MLAVTIFVGKAMFEKPAATATLANNKETTANDQVLLFMIGLFRVGD